ncbi:MAG: glycosyltransferase family 2 protein [Candidatus Aminicenantales bacterium]|jgi:hypothetical protein
MIKSNYDIAVAYRVYPAVSKTPLFHADNKFDLVRLSVKSFRSSLGNLKAKMYIFLDNCPKEYENIFLESFSRDDLEFIHSGGIGNYATFNLQIEYLLKQTESKIVYFAEDDYLYQEGMFEKAVYFLKKNKHVDFVSPYDHMDYYTLPFHSTGSYKMAFYCGLHWRTAHSTCLTFLTTKDVLRRTQHIFRSYSRGNHDCSMWLGLTKFNGLNVLTNLRNILSSGFYFKIYVKAIYYCWKNIFFGRKYYLWVPIPAIGTHLESSLISPGVDWYSIFNKIENRKNFRAG